MEMILGILIGLVIWQVAVFTLLLLRIEDLCWVCPIPYFCFRLVEFIVSLWEMLLDIKAIIYFIKLGKNPFKTSIKELASLDDVHKKKMLELSHPKHKQQMEKVFGYCDKHPKMKPVSKEVQEALDKLPKL